MDDIDDYGDTQPFEPLTDFEAAAPPGYHIAQPSVSRSAPPGQISRMFPAQSDPNLGTKTGPAAPQSPNDGGGKLGSQSPSTGTSSTSMPPMGGKMGGKLGNDATPGKISSESPPGGSDVPVESPSSDGSPNPNPIPQEALDILESMGFDTDPFNEIDPNTGESSTTTSTTTIPPSSSGGSPNSGAPSGGEESGGEGEGGDQSSNAEDAAEDGGVNVDKLARDVFNVLRDRLRIEQERRSTR